MKTDSKNCKKDGMIRWKSRWYAHAPVLFAAGKKPMALRYWTVLFAKHVRQKWCAPMYAIPNILFLFIK